MMHMLMRIDDDGDDHGTEPDYDGGAGDADGDHARDDEDDGTTAAREDGNHDNDNAHYSQQPPADQTTSG